MKAKKGYKDQKPGPERWDARRKRYTVIGKALHRYFLLRTTRKNKPEEEDLRCDGTCPFCMPPEDPQKEPSA